MSVGIIQYNDIRNNTLSEALVAADRCPKLNYGTMKVGDLLIDGKIDSLEFVEFNTAKNFGRGIYIIYENSRPIYVGLADFHFFHRFSSHIHIDTRTNWGWNALLKKLAMRETGKVQVDLNLDDYHDARKLLYRCEVLRIHVNDDAVDLYNLERVFQRGIRRINPTGILNGRVRQVDSAYLDTTLSQLL